METVVTPLGELAVTGMVERYSDGALKACNPATEAVLHTDLGDFTPQHTTDDLRRRTVQPISFHADGTLRSLPLERAAMIHTSAGPIPAELVTFHENGAVNRVFPLNGRLSGYWSEEDEAGLAMPVILKTPMGVKNLRIISASFWPSGTMRSLTLWPGETVSVPTPCGEILARIGVSFHEDGTVASLEPAEPVTVDTVLGPIRAFDPDAVGINGDANSLAFDEKGGLERISTVQSKITVKVPGAADLVFEPAQRESLCGDSDTEPEPLRIEFSDLTATFITDAYTPPTIVEIEAATFATGSCIQLFDPAALRSCTM